MTPHRSHRQKKFPVENFQTKGQSGRETPPEASDTTLAAKHPISDTMGGRQAHGRPVTAKPLGKKKASKSKAKPSKNHRTRALDAYKIASQVLPDAEKKTPRAKHGREAVGEDLDDQGPRRKKARRATEEEDDESEVEYGSDDEGNKWTLGGPVAEEDDSEIDSDEAFGESDEENFEGFAFRGSKSKKTEVG